MKYIIDKRTGAYVRDDDFFDPDLEMATDSPIPIGFHVDEKERPVFDSKTGKWTGSLVPGWVLVDGIPEKASERDRVLMGAVSLQSVADGAMSEINSRFTKVFSDLEAKYPSAEREDWPSLIADAKRVGELSDENLNTEENRKVISFLGIEVLGTKYDPAQKLSEEQIAAIRSKAGRILAKASAFRFAVAGAKNVKQVSQRSIAEALDQEDAGRAYDAIQSVLGEVEFPDLSRIDEREMYRLGPAWPPAGYREDPPDSGRLVKVSENRKSVLGRIAGIGKA